MVVCPTCQARYGAGTTACPLDGTDLRDVAPIAAASAPAAAAAPAVELREGVMLDHRLRILRQLGQGGMGTVYAALHVGLGKEVAVKVLVDRYSGSSEIAQRLKQEARLASAIHDPRIVEIFDIGETADGRAFVVMELLRGESLAQRLQREGALPEREALRLVRQVAAALEAAHRAGVVHRDVKPENIFLCPRATEDAGAPRDAEPLVKLLDFGLSKAVRSDPQVSLHLTQTGMIMGTPLYMSPEQARGEEDLDHGVDIYALGVVLYECLTGDVPFRANNYLGVISKIVTERVPPPRQRHPEISEAAERVVLRAMDKDRRARYPSAAALGAGLDAALRGGASGRSGGFVERLREVTPAGRRPPGLWALSLGAALLLALALLWLVPVNSAGPPPRAALDRDAALSAPDAAVAHSPDMAQAPLVPDAAPPDAAAPPDLRLPPRPRAPRPLRGVTPEREPDSDDPELAPLPAPLRRSGARRGTVASP